MKTKIGGFLGFALCIASMAATADELATYDAQTMSLFVPAVSTTDRAGAVQNVTISYDGDDKWVVTDGWDAWLLGNSVNNVDLILKGDAPVQAYLRISGFISPCLEVGRSAQKIVENRIYIYAYYLENDFIQSEEPLACVDSVESFEHIVPLDIYGLEAGDYEYVFNDEFVGEFSLGVENVLGE
jgi:hypothetical protein